MKDPLSALAKKKKTSLPAPEKVSTHFTASAPSSPALQKPQKIQSQKVQAQQVKPVRYHAKAKQQTQAQAPAYRNEDFQFATNVDQLGINILVRFQGTLIYQFLLSTNDYELWQRMNFWAQKYEYVKMKVNPSCFMNDNQLVYIVIKTIMNILDTLFTEAQKVAMREQQAKAQQQQRTQAQKRRVYNSR